MKPQHLELLVLNIASLSARRAWIETHLEAMQGILVHVALRKEGVD